MKKAMKRTKVNKRVSPPSTFSYSHSDDKASSDRIEMLISMNNVGSKANVLSKERKK